MTALSQHDGDRRVDGVALGDHRAGQYAYQKVEADPFAQAALLEIEQEFWACVVDGRYARIPLLADAVISDSAAVVSMEGNDL